MFNKKKHINENFPSNQKVFAKKQLEQRELLNHRIPPQQTTRAAFSRLI